VVLHPDGSVTAGRRQAGESLYLAVRAAIPRVRTLGSTGLGLARLWYHDMFTSDLPANRLADDVIAALGYHHPTGWYGPVAVSMDEDPRTGEVPAIPREVLQVIAGHAAAIRQPPAGRA
jgi:hypothetical protein